MRAFTKENDKICEYFEMLGVFQMQFKVRI